MMDPTQMTEEQLLRELMRQEAKRLVLHEAQSTRAISPVETKAPRTREGPSEHMTWLVLGGATAALTLLCLYWML